MKPPFTTIPLAGALVRIIDADGENITVMPARPAAQLVALVNTIPALACTLEHVAIEMFRTSMPDMCEMACAIEGVVQIVNPTFRLAVDGLDGEESALYAQALMELNSAPAACVAGEESGSGSLLR